MHFYGNHHRDKCGKISISDMKYPYLYKVGCLHCENINV
ncbi:Uncharacterised protein [Yersinia frederiksenii]|uniref:Uncharacterized protein n=1 Tax=Yersinia frederiksenii TaxID=29484 RepID=A0A380PSA5_YERFR|nr:Uncharacterised protein [Yersinia frederiksenii]